MKKSIIALLAFCIISISFPRSSNAVSTSTDAFAESLAKSAGISSEQAKTNIEQVFSALAQQLESGGEVSIRKFGKFYVQQRAERMAKNPKTGAPVKVPAKKYPKFTSSDVLKDQLNAR